MRIYSVLAIICLVASGLALEVRVHSPLNDHQLFGLFGYGGYSTNTIPSAISTIFTAVVIVAIAVGCYFCCRSVVNQTRQAGPTVFIPPSQNQRQYQPIQPINYNQPSYNQPRYSNNPPMPITTPVYVQPVNNYQQNDYRVGAYPQLEDHIPVKANPYSNTMAPAYQMTYDVVARQKLRQPCAQCHYQSKGGEQNSVMVPCSKNHCYHLNCFKDLLKEQYLQGSMYRCGKCQETYQSRVKLFCTSCMQNHVFVDLPKFIKKHCQLDIQELSRTYGDQCSDCLRL